MLRLIDRKIATAHADGYTTGCLLAYDYFENYYKMIAIDLSKQKALAADPKAVQQVTFDGNVNRAKAATMFFIIEEAKESILDFSQGLWNYSNFIFCFNIKWLNITL